MSASDHLQPAQFFHGSTHEFTPGEMVEPGHPRTDNIGNGGYKGGADDHVFFTSRNDRAAWYAARTSSFYRHHPEHAPAVYGTHVYEVEPTGHYELDSQHRDDEFKSPSPLRVVRDATPEYLR